MAAGSPSAALSAGGVFSEESGCFFGRWGLPLASQVIAAPRAAEHVVPTARRFRCVLLEPLADGTEGADGAAAAGADGAAAAAAAAAAAGADTGAVADEAGKESMCQELRGGKGVTHFFVYGSLRPDDTMGMPWTKQFQDGFDYVSRAVLPGALLFDDRFAAVTLDGGSKGQSVHGFLLGLRSRPGEAGLTPEQDCLLSEKLATCNHICNHICSHICNHTSLLKGGAATASIVTDSDDAILICIEGSFLEHLFGSNPKLPGRFFAFLASYQAKRLRNLTELVSKDRHEVAGQHLAKSLNLP